MSGTEQVKAVHSTDELLRYLPHLCIIKFTASWCGPCRAIAPVVEQLAAEYSDIWFLSVDIDECNSIASVFNVQSMPTFVGVFNHAEVARFSGADKEQLQNLANTVRNHKTTML